MNIQHLPKEFKIKEGAEEFPLMVVLSMSYVCNSKCPGCPYTNSNIRDDYGDALFMPVDLFKKIADECGKYGAFLRFSGGGEPLLHPRVIKLIEYAKIKGAKVGLITNGSLMTPDKADKILACDTDMIEFSVDAADAETYNIVRKGLNFDKLVKNIKYTVNRRNELKSSSKIIVSVINQKAIQGKIKKVIKFWEAMVDGVQVRKYLTWGINKKEESADSSPYLPPEDRIPCPWLFERLNIDSRGDVTVCGEDIAFNEKFANVNDKLIKDIWHSKTMNYFRKKHLDRKGDEIMLCKKCPDWQYRSWAHNYWKVEKEAENKRAKALSKK